MNSTHSVPPETLQVHIHTDVDLTSIVEGGALSEDGTASGGGFADGDVSGIRPGAERGLQVASAWLEDPVVAKVTAGGLTGGNHKTGSWDQFKANEEKFGIR